MGADLVSEAQDNENEPIETSEDLATKKKKKYKSKFDIPISEQNYTDAHKKDHPIWAKNLFTKEYKSFDEIFVPWKAGQEKPLSSSDIYEHYVKPHAICLHNCYQMIRKWRAKAGGDKKKLIKLY